MIDLAKIKAALAAATPGPWRLDGNAIEDALGNIVANGPRLGDRRAPGGPDDAHLIAHAPEWLAQLIAEVEAKDAEIARLRPSNDVVSAREAARRRMRLDGADAQALEHAITITERERDEARAEVERLRAALSEIARPKRGGIEAAEPDADHIAYWTAATERERKTAREALSRFDAARGKDGE